MLLVCRSTNGSVATSAVSGLSDSGVDTAPQWQSHSFAGYLYFAKSQFAFYALPARRAVSLPLRKCV
jgi:hypothetical protein